MMWTQHNLNVRRVDTATKPGRLADGGGLYLRIKPSGAKSWSFKWKRDGKSNELVIGPYPAVSLAAARQKAAHYRELLAAGGNPRAEKAKTSEPTFGECVDQFLATMGGQWSNAKHRQQWRSAVTDYCQSIADRKVSEIGLHDVLAVLKPIWNEKPVTASRLRGRVERILSFAQTNGWRNGANPALWRGNLQNVLPKPAKLVQGHHASP